MARFRSDPLAQALRYYIEERKRSGWVPEDNDPIFVTEGSVSRGVQLDPQGAWEIIKNAAQKAGFKRQAVWTHVLRKTFRKVLNGTPMDEDTKESLMGHKLPGSRGSYFDYHDVDEVAEKYMKVEWSRTPETRLERQLREASEEIDSLKAELAGLKSVELGDRVQRLENILTAALTREGLSKEAMEDLVKGKGLETRVKRKYVAED